MYPKRYNHFMGCKTTILAPTPVHDFLHLLDLLSTSSSSAIKKIHDGSVPVSGFSPSATVVFRLPSAKLFSWHRPPVDAAPRSRASIIPFPRGGGCEIYYDPPRPRPRLVIVRTVRTYGAVGMCSSSSRTRVQTTKEEKRDRLPPRTNEFSIELFSSYVQVSTLDSLGFKVRGCFSKNIVLYYIFENEYSLDNSDRGYFSMRKEVISNEEYIFYYYHFVKRNFVFRKYNENYNFVMLHKLFSYIHSLFLSL